jgi:hypothetical protein
MDLLWSASTTMRNSERTLRFLKTATEIENEIWNNETQNKYQTLIEVKKEISIIQSFDETAAI